MGSGGGSFLLFLEEMGCRGRWGWKVSIAEVCSWSHIFFFNFQAFSLLNSSDWWQWGRRFGTHLMFPKALWRKNKTSSWWRSLQNPFQNQTVWGSVMTFMELCLFSYWGHHLLFPRESKGSVSHCQWKITLRVYDVALSDPRVGCSYIRYIRQPDEPIKVYK